MENSNFCTDAEFVSMINSSAAELYEVLVFRFEDYFVDELFFSLSSSEDGYTMPSSCFKLLGVDVKQSDGYHGLERWELHDRNRYQHDGCVDTLRYKLHGQKLKLLPSTRASGYTFRVWFIPKYTNASSINDNVGYLELQNWHEYITVDVCIKVLSKQESDASLFVMQKQALLERITKHASQRDVGKPFCLPFDDADLYGIPRARW